MAEATHATHGHFEALEQQAHAAKIGMAAFLASEVLLFAGLFTTFFAYRTAHGAAFAAGAVANTKTLGSINTGVLLASSGLVAFGVQEIRRARAAQTRGLLSGAIALGVTFLAIKFTEYGLHFREGIFPGGQGAYFAMHVEPGLSAFWTLYYVMTGLHAIHVTVGVGVLAFLRARTRAEEPLEHPFAIGALYWHLVDLIWIFLWPMFYLGGGR
jgi:cytochrome c oxidase subunit 3